MPGYVVRAVDPGSGRKRQRTIRAKNANEAQETVESEGLTVRSVEQLPDREPSKEQLSYAAAYGLDVPDGCTFDDLYDMIARCVALGKPVDAWLRDYAPRRGVSWTGPSTHDQLLTRVAATLDDQERCRLFAGFVLDRPFRTFGWPGVLLENGGVDLDRLTAMLLATSRLRQSIGRTHSDLNLMHGAISRDCIAWKEGRRFAREMAGKEQTSRGQKQRRNEKSGCALEVFVAIVAAALLSIAIASATGCNTTKAVHSTKPIRVERLHGWSASRAYSALVRAGAAIGHEVGDDSVPPVFLTLKEYGWGGGFKILVANIVVDLDEQYGETVVTLRCREDYVGRSPEDYVDRLWRQFSAGQ